MRPSGRAASPTGHGTGSAGGQAPGGARDAARSYAAISMSGSVGERDLRRVVDEARGRGYWVIELGPGDSQRRSNTFRCAQSFPPLMTLRIRPRARRTATSFTGSSPRRCRAPAARRAERIDGAWMPRSGPALQPGSFSPSAMARPSACSWPTIVSGRKEERRCGIEELYVTPARAVRGRRAASCPRSRQARRGFSAHSNWSWCPPRRRAGALSRSRFVDVPRQAMSLEL